MSRVLFSPLVLALLSSVNAYAQEEASPDKDSDTSASTPQGSEKAPAKAAETAAPEKSAETSPAVKEDQGGGLILPWARIGATVGVGIPAVFEFSLESRILDRFGLGFGLFPTYSYKFADAEASGGSWNVHARWFPFMGSFHLGARFGSQALTAKATTKVTASVGGVPLSEVPVTAALDVKTTFLTPMLGWMGTYDSGFTIGTEFGYQMAMSATSKLDLSYGRSLSPAEQQLVDSNADMQKAKKAAQDLGKVIGETALPYWNILTLGWLF